MNSYVQRVIEKTKNKYSNQPEYVQAVEEVLGSISSEIDLHPEYERVGLLERLIEPERIFQFRVSWLDDNNIVRVNTGYRVQYNGAIGPYKGGLRFHPSVNQSVLKFLGFEQTFKNSLTGLPIGGGKGGSDFDPHGKSDNEIMRFCQSFMNELYRYIGPDCDVPAGDIGVGAREVGYLFGQYRKLRGNFENGVLTGKDLSFGGSLLRPEATGYGVVYYANEVFKHFNDNLAGKTFVLSGYGNVAWGCIKKINELGGKVLTISGHNGFVYDEDGINSEEKINYLLSMRASKDGNVKMYADKFNCKFYENQKPWAIKGDVYIPCASQNEVLLADAKNIVENGAKYYFEAANMPTSLEAVAYLRENGVIVGPAKAVNAGGVAVSCLEMAQNASHLSWSSEDVDEKLKMIMKNIHDESAKAAFDNGLGYDLIAGANIVGFRKVARAMLAQGVI